MSKPLIDGSAIDVKEAFRKKTLFGVLTTSKYTNLVDFNFAEKQLYGRVNRTFSPIVATENVFNFVGIPSLAGNNVVAYDFVVYAFTQLQNKFKIKLLSGEIQPNETFLSDIVAHKGYRDPKGLYDSYTSAYAEAMREIAREEKIDFTNFNEFVDKMMPFIENTIKNNKPFTYPAFVKDKKCPINASGLVIEIGDVDPSNDMQKYEDFYSSRNWEFYLNACNTYGFMVDANNPQRLIADIGSAVMTQNMRLFNNGIGTTDAFLDLSYEPVGSNYFQNFKFFLYNIYNESRKPKIVTLTENLNNGDKLTIEKTISYTFENFQTQFGDLYFFELYAKIRFMEEESQFSEYEKNSLITESVGIAKINLPAAIDIFESILNKTFDYSGSLSYITQSHKNLRL
jgi:hypothetical protein